MRPTCCLGLVVWLASSLAARPRNRNGPSLSRAPTPLAAPTTPPRTTRRASASCSSAGTAGDSQSRRYVGVRRRPLGPAQSSPESPGPLRPRHGLRQRPGRVVLFGRDRQRVRGYLRRHVGVDGYTWTQRTSSTSPSGRYLPRDGLRQGPGQGRAVRRLFRFGQSRRDVGVDGTNWTQRTPSTSPPNRRSAGMSYDAVRGRVVMFGGNGLPLGILADTWEWDGTSWVSLAPATSPPSGEGFPMTFDSTHGKTVMHRGTSIWEWNGVNWTQRYLR